MIGLRTDRSVSATTCRLKPPPPPSPMPPPPVYWAHVVTFRVPFHASHVRRTVQMEHHLEGVMETEKAKEEQRILDLEEAQP